MRATLTGKYETDKDDGKASTILTINTNVGDAKLKASVTNALVVNTAKDSPPKFSLTLEKPDSFSVVYSRKPVILSTMDSRSIRASVDVM